MPRALCIAEVRTAAGAAAATACRLSVMAAGFVAASRTTGVVTGVATTAVELGAGRAGAAAGGAGTVAKRAAAAADPATTAARRVSADRRDTGLVGTASSFVSTAGPNRGSEGAGTRTARDALVHPDGDPVSVAPDERRYIRAFARLRKHFADLQ